MNTTRDFTKGKIFEPLFKFALPVLAAMLLQAMYGAVDLLIVGKFGVTADVSAVSIGSQLTHSRCVAFFEDTVPGKNDPSEILSILNKRLAQNNQAQMFVTAMLGILDLSNGELIYSNATYFRGIA